MKSNEEKVSWILGKILDWVAGDIDVDAPGVDELLPAQFKRGFQICMWWRGCYYCQDSRGRWIRKKCYA